jgi:phage FluMu protein Com
MNFGGCPYDDCDGILMFCAPAKTPSYAQVKCPDCKRTVWYKFSRWNPESWTEKDFNSKFILDETNHTIKERV